MMPFMLAAHPNPIQSRIRISIYYSYQYPACLLAFLPSCRSAVLELLSSSCLPMPCLHACAYRMHACNFFMFASFRRKQATPNFRISFALPGDGLEARPFASFRNLTHLVFQWADTHAAGSTQRVSTTGSRSRYYRYLILPWPEGVTPEGAPIPGSGGRNLPTT